MSKNSEQQGVIWVITPDPVATTRGVGGARQLKVQELSVNMTIFLEQIGGLLEQTPEMVGKFRFDEFEIHADITAQGTLALLGSGVQAGATGGLKFVFRRSMPPVDK